MGAVAKVVGIRVASSPAFPQAKTGVGAPAEIVFGRRDPGRACRRSRPALDDGGVLPAREGAWPRPLRGTLLAWVAPPHEPVHGRRCASGEVGRRSAPIRFRPTVPEIRYLLARLLLTSPTRPAFIMAWSLWRRPPQGTKCTVELK